MIWLLQIEIAKIEAEILLSFISQFKYQVSDPVSGLKIYNVNKLNKIDYYNEKNYI